MHLRGRVRGLWEDLVGSKSLILFVFLLLVGCAEPPLALDDHRPEISDAVIERDLVVFGTMEVVYTTRGQNPEVVCTGDFDVVGWVEEDLSSTDVGCTGCSENYTLAPTFDESTCNSVRARGAPTLVLQDFDFFPHNGTQGRQNTFDFLTGDYVPPSSSGPAERFGRSNWNAVSFYDDGAFAGLFGVYPSGSPPLVPADLEEPCSRELYLLAAWSTALSSDFAAGWAMNLCFTE